MKNRAKRGMAFLLLLVLVLSGCSKPWEQTESSNDVNVTNEEDSFNNIKTDKPEGSTQVNTDQGKAEAAVGENISEDLYVGYSETAPADFSKVTITCISGTEGCVTMEGSTITFAGVSEDSVYAISGEFKGNIVIDVAEDYKFDLELHGLSVSSDSINPVHAINGDKVTITAKKNYKNYIYDMREAVDETSEAGAVYAEVDLEIAGKGELIVVSENNNGIHTKKDLEVKNLSLTVYCTDNALKGNDSVTLDNATATLIATMGDGIKTSNSDVSGKGNQRGTISVLGGNYTVYAACDGMDAAYDVVVEEAENTTVLNIFTDKYSNYSKEVTAVAEEVNYIRFISEEWKYSVKYYNSEDDFVWVNPEYHSKVSGGRTTYYYYSYPKMPGYDKVQFFIYSSDMEQGQEEDYIATTEYLTVNTEYDTFALASQGNSLSYNWTNYTTQINEGFGGFGDRGGPGGGPGGFGGPGGGRGGMGGFGGMNEGNSDKGDYSTKGIKAANEIIINAGTVNIKSYDDAIHANNDTALESGATPKGNVTINGGVVSFYSNDDGLHADGTVAIKNGLVTISNSYEGVEGAKVEISGGKVTISAKDDGINATTTTGNAVYIGGGEIYICCTGDGIDSNSRTSYEGIIFAGGNTIVISNSGGNSAIDTEQGYKYEGGAVVAIMPSGGMSNEAVHCENFSSVGSKMTSAMILDRYLTVTADGEAVVTLQMPVGLSGMVVYLGSKAASVSMKESTTATLDENGVCWFK